MELVAVKYMYKSLKDQSFVFVTDSVLLWMEGFHSGEMDT